MKTGVYLLAELALRADEASTVHAYTIERGVCLRVLDYHGDTVLQLDLTDQQANQAIAALAQVVDQ